MLIFLSFLVCCALEYTFSNKALAKLFEPLDAKAIGLAATATIFLGQ